MEPLDPYDPLARERARKRRAQQIQRRRLVALILLLALIILIVGLAVGLSGGDDATEPPSDETTETTEPTDTTFAEEDTSTTELTSTVFTAELTGDQSVPSVDTLATATLTLQYDSDENTLSFVLDVVSMITNPSVASIYEGEPGSEGAAIVTLFAGPTETGEFEGVLAEGFIEEDDLIGSLQGQSIEDLVALMATGGTYCSLGNESHPVDAIRGQIE